MPLCGFNAKMLEGLTMFDEGLVEHGLLYRGNLRGESLDQGIRRELSDMSRLQPELFRIDSVPKRTITRGIATYATGFYLLMRQKGLADNPAGYKKFISQINDYFRRMDEKYYGELDGRADDMKLLAEYLNSIDI